MKIGDVVTVRCAPVPGDPTEPETWMQGPITATVASSPVNGNQLHIVEPSRFKWARSDPWRAYDGVRFNLVREVPGLDYVEWVDTWPRRYEY